MHWHEQTWPTLRNVDRQTPVVIPLGSCEQHGHHLPVFTDTMQVDAIARRAEADRPHVLFLPTLWLGSSHHHKDFGGTISLPPALYSSVIESVTGCILGAGFRRLLFLNGHGGNITPTTQALTQLIATRDDADDAHLALASWWGIGSGLASMSDTFTSPDIKPPFVTHACEVETSVMLAVRPDLVGKPVDQGTPALSSPHYSFEYGGAVNVFRRFHRLTASGAMGHPTHGSAEKGAAIIDAVAGDVVAFLDDFATWPDLPRRGPDPA